MERKTKRMAFKPGDLVVLCDKQSLSSLSDGQRKLLTSKKFHRVVSYDGLHVTIEGMYFGFSKERFKLYSHTGYSIF